MPSRGADRQDTHILDWTEKLARTLASAAAQRGRPPRLAVLGIGQELCGDDAAGVVVVRELSARVGKRPGVRFLDAGPAPENQAGALRRFAPDLVLLVDAADLGGAPGSVRWLDWQQTEGLSASTHTLPLCMLGQYLTCELGCAVAVLGIQPAGNEFDAPLSEAVRGTVDEVIRGVLAAL